MKDHNMTVEYISDIIQLKNKFEQRIVNMKRISPNMYSTLPFYPTYFKLLQLMQQVEDEARKIL